MKRLYILSAMSFDTELLDYHPDDYSTEEIVDALRDTMLDNYSHFDIEVSIEDYYIEEDLESGEIYLQDW